MMADFSIGNIAIVPNRNASDALRKQIEHKAYNFSKQMPEILQSILNDSEADVRDLSLLSFTDRQPRWKKISLSTIARWGNNVNTLQRSDQLIQALFSNSEFKAWVSTTRQLSYTVGFTLVPADVIHRGYRTRLSDKTVSRQRGRGRKKRFSSYVNDIDMSHLIQILNEGGGGIPARPFLKGLTANNKLLLRQYLAEKLKTEVGHRFTQGSYNRTMPAIFKGSAFGDR